MAEITVAAVGKLRERTNAGLMDCKKALTEANGDMDLAVDILRKKGVATAAGKAAREAKEGVIAQHILPGSRLGVLVEISAGQESTVAHDEFKQLVRDITLQIAAAHPIAVSREQVDPAIVAKEREIAAEQVKDKPPQAITRIVGHVRRL